MKKKETLLKEYKIVTNKYGGFDVYRRFNYILFKKWEFESSQDYFEHAKTYIDFTIARRLFRSKQVWP